MEKYKYCNIGRARELSSGGREGGKGGKAGKGFFDCTEGRDAHKRVDVPCGIRGGCCVRIKTESESRIRV